MLNMHNCKFRDVPMVKEDKLSIKHCPWNDKKKASMLQVLILV